MKINRITLEKRSLTMGSLGIHTSPLPKPFEESIIDFGVQLSGIDIENLNGESQVT